MLFTIKKFETGFTVVELPDESTVNMPCQLLPEGTREGDIIDIRINRVELKRRMGGIKYKKDAPSLVN